MSGLGNFEIDKTADGLGITISLRRPSHRKAWGEHMMAAAEAVAAQVANDAEVTLTQWHELSDAVEAIGQYGLVLD